jgi:hypothetical protein
MMITSDNFLALFGNIIDRKGINNIKFFEILSAGMNLYNEYYEKILFTDVIDFQQGQELDLYGRQFNLYRNKMNDNDFRKLIKSYLILRFSGTNMNGIIKSISLFLGIKKEKIFLYDKNNDSKIESRHIRILVKDTVEIKKVIDFLKQIKAAGIIIDCWEMIVSTPEYEYNTLEYDSLYFPSDRTQYILDCSNNIIIYNLAERVAFEYNKHQYDVNELESLNDN